MKHFFVIFLLPLIISCSHTVPQLDKKCIDARYFRVVQRILNNYAIAFPCQSDCLTVPMLLPPQSQVFYYQGMKVPNPSDKCAIVIGSFRYPTQNGGVRRIPIIKWQDK
ncbi:MAG: hypothetical protein IJY58_06280 [Alphaproteobacteria bacterium]|nr:hypothetical protein [Alphaproteobacteria bacterium]